MADQQIVIDIVTRLDKLEKDMRRAGAKTDKFGQKIKKLGMIMAGVTAGIYALTKGIGSLVKAYARQEKEEKLLARAIQNRVGSLEEAAAATEALIKFAKERQQVTAFGDEATIAAMKIGATFPLTVEQIRQLTIRAQDFAAATGKDLVSAMADLGRATEGQFGMLTRYGVSIRDVTKETGDFNMLLEDLDSNFGGFAETMATTVEGRWKQLSNLIGDAKERLGQALLPALEKLYALGQKIPGMMDKIGPTLSKVVEALVDVADAIFPIVEDLLPAIGPLLQGIAEAIKFVAKLLKPFTESIGRAIKDLNVLLNGFTFTEAQAQRIALQNYLRVPKGIRAKTIELAGVGVLTEEQARQRLEQLKSAEYGEGGIFTGEGLDLTGEQMAEMLRQRREGTGGIGVGVSGAGGGKGGKSNIIQIGPYAGFTVEDAIFFHDEQMGMLDDMTDRMMEANNTFSQFQETWGGEMTEEEKQAWQQRQDDIKKTQDTYVDFAQAIKSQFDNVFGAPMMQLFDGLKFQIDDTMGTFEKFFKSIANNLIDLIAKIATQALAFAGIITALNLIPPPGTIGTAFAKFLAGGSFGNMGMDIGGGNVGGLIGKLFSGGYDSPINDAWARRQGADFAREFASGLQNSMVPNIAGFGGITTIEYPAGLAPWIRIYKQSPEADKRELGYVNRESTAISQRTDI